MSTIAKIAIETHDYNMKWIVTVWEPTMIRLGLIVQWEDPNEAGNPGIVQYKSQNDAFFACLNRGMKLVAVRDGEWWFSGE